MRKPQALRKKLSDLIPFFKQNPENLTLFCSQGQLNATGAMGESFETEYTLEIFATDVPLNPDVFFVIILAFVRTEQSELLFNPSSKKITFEAEPLNNDLYDFTIKIPLTERVRVKNTAGRLEVSHLDEPQHDASLFDNLILEVTHPTGDTETLKEQKGQTYA